ncbi:MAG: peptidoglycan-binding protein [Hyphomonadaceae bacterium]|nr:peptidoglycan-binding protein [Hyphomonadaceae bacterium]
MTPRQARIALGLFVVMAAGVAYNALYMQGDTGASKVAGEAATRAGAPRPDGPPPTRPRTAQTTKRTAQLKPDSAKAPETLDVLPAEAGADTVRAIQRELNQRGFGPVAGDGVMRPVTRAAIMSYEHDNRLPLTGEATEALLTRLVLGAPATNVPAGAGQVQSPHAEAIVRQVQRLLAASGYGPGPANGRLGSETVTAIRAFEQDQGLSPKGRISAEVMSRLQGSATKFKAAEAH